MHATANDAPRIHRLGRDDLALMSGLLSMFGAAFDDAATYDARRPGPSYLRSLVEQRAGQRPLGLLAGAAHDRRP